VLRPLVGQLLCHAKGAIADTRYWEIAPEVRSERVLFGTRLDVKRAASGALLVPGQPGPALTYRKTGSGFTTQASADAAATQLRDAADQVLDAVAQINAGVFPPVVQVYTYP
jgi:hypothetical protein